MDLTQINRGRNVLWVHITPSNCQMLSKLSIEVNPLHIQYQQQKHRGAESKMLYSFTWRSLALTRNALLRWSEGSRKTPTLHKFFKKAKFLGYCLTEALINGKLTTFSDQQAASSLASLTLPTRQSRIQQRVVLENSRRISFTKEIGSACCCILRNYARYGNSKPPPNPQVSA